MASSSRGGMGVSDHNQAPADHEVVPSSLSEIAPILRVANEFEKYYPRVAYICRFHAFKQAHMLDPTTSTRGMLQFKTALLQRLEREHDPTLMERVSRSDDEEMRSFYQDYCKKYMQVLQNIADKVDRSQLKKAYQTANVILEVLKSINKTISQLKKEYQTAKVLFEKSGLNMASSSRGGMGMGVSDQNQAPARRLSRSQNSEVVPSSLSKIAPILRVADEVDKSNPRVAYLCRFHAFEKAHMLDPNCSARGVRQFKTALLQRLEREIAPTLMKRVSSSDAAEIQSFYQDYCKKYIQALQKAADKADRSQLTKAYQTANVLFEVLKAVNKTYSMKILKTHNKVAEKTRMYVPYNILPLDPDSANRPIMRFPEIHAAVLALQNTRGLPWPNDYMKKQNNDILDWLQSIFVFQKDNVANPIESLILLLAHVHTRQFPEPDHPPKLNERSLTAVMKKLFRATKDGASTWIARVVSSCQKYIRRCNNVNHCTWDCTFLCGARLQT